MLELGWPEHDKDLGQVLLTPPSGHSIGTLRLSQTAA